MKKFRLLSIVTCILFVACQKVVDADGLLDTEEKLYITSYISPQDTILRVSVTKALSSIGTPLSVNDQVANENKFLIKDAIVSISNEEGERTDLSYSEEQKVYLVDANTLAILSNKNYYLNVVVANEEYNASCHIPEKVTEINETINLKDDDGYSQADINLSFQDISDKINFYVLGGKIKITEQYEESEPYTQEYSLWFDTDEFLTDNLEDGGVLNGKSISYIGDAEVVQQTTLTLQVANIEEILFQNLRTLSTNSDAEGNPFVEYAIAPSNFEEEGVIGVFAGYQITEKEIELDF